MHVSYNFPCALLYTLLIVQEKYGLLLYNGGKATDFLAVELMDGHIHLLISLDKKTIQLKVKFIHVS